MDVSERDDFRAQRLYVSAALVEGAVVPLSPEHASYLLAVLRLKAGDRILVFNGRDGEWRAAVRPVGRRDAALEIMSRVREQAGGPDIHYLFAPLKRARLDYVVQKATEMGVARLRPVITERTVVERVKLERIRANVIEAAEQCGVMRIPELAEPKGLQETIAGWDPDRTLVFCDEEAPVQDPVAALSAIARGPVAVLIGPEGGFTERERAALIACPATTRIALGPRIMRADTAAVAALALVNAVLGDWR